MIASICKKTGSAVLFLECERCKEKYGCQVFSAFWEGTEEKRKPVSGNVKNGLEEIVKKAVKEDEQIGNRRERCDFCEFCGYVKTIRKSGCDVGLYECKNQESKRYGTKMDEAYVWRNSCEYFHQK